MQLRKNNQQALHTGNHHTVTWVRPEFGTFKVNCDASVRRNGFVGVGFIVRDDQGGVIGSGVNRFQRNFSVDCAETIAVRSAMLYARSLGPEDIIVENDSSIVIEGLRWGRSMPTTMLAIAKD